MSMFQTIIIASHKGLPSGKIGVLLGEARGRGFKQRQVFSRAKFSLVFTLRVPTLLEIRRPHS
jgi:hypothetical protein